ncbi:alpha-xylosidase [Halorubrum persicum]|uniref:Alpha-xylosidase n=1 Tax=Halorubrum persicum TaxID=1383844 RepID=A0A2G1WHA1_9EURY|nr:glycoside hydrolase family 31 protein [Halorubrum persicum]PHQ38378.1 alpha-xylosidase [Halorubrum persicum]
MSAIVVSAVDSYDVSDRTVTLSCAVEADERDVTRTVPVSIRFHAPGIFRFELRTNPEAPAAEGPRTYAPEAIREPVSLSVTEAEGTLLVETSALTLRIGTDEWAFDVSDADGRTLLSEQRSDRNAKGAVRSRPLGFDEEVVNGWPLRVDTTRTAFALRPDERIYGFGEKFTEFDKRGREIESWITQPNGAETERAYKNVPWFVSTRGYGLLVDTVHRTRFDVGASSSVTNGIRVDDDDLRFVFVHGPEFKSILRRYTAMTGRPNRPEPWTFGVWMSRLSYESREEVESVAARLRERSIPCDVLHIDPAWMSLDDMCDLRWDTDAFPEPAAMIDGLAADGFRVSLWEFPYVQVDSPLFEEFARKGYFVEDGSGSPYVLSRLSADNRGAIVDFTDPDAREWWAERHRQLTELGVDAFKLDFGEYLPRDAVLANGRTGAAMRNRYPRAYQRTVRDAMRSAGTEPTLWVRAAWTGDQVFPIHWGGDPNTTFESMAASLRGGLSLALSGFPFWAADIGGFRGTPSTELYVRWAQWALLGNSHARFHGTTPREPWEFGERAERIVREHAEERYRLLPYLCAYGERASREGLPVMRPLVLEHQGDPAARAIDTQHYVGEELMIAPVLSDDGRREIYLPDGEWVDYWTGERYVGSQVLDRDVPLDTVPLFVRAGSIVPTREASQHVGEGPWTLRLRVEFESDPDGEPETVAFEYHGRTEGESGTITAVREPDTGAVRVETPGGCSVTEVRVARLAEPPSVLSVDGTAYERVDGEPERQEWTFDPETGVARAAV